MKFRNTISLILINLLCAIIFLDVQFIQPPINLFKVTFNESSSSVQLTCSLNVNIPSSVTVTWFLNTLPFLITPNKVIQSGNTTTLLIENPQPSDAGVYECSFMGLNDVLLRRVIVLG